MANPIQPGATCGVPSRRIINKIPLDFNKLRCAGLDRILAEELSKHNARGRNFNSVSTTIKTGQQLHLPDSRTSPPEEQHQMDTLADTQRTANIEQCCRICMDNSNQLMNIMSPPDKDGVLSIHEMLNDVMDEAYKVDIEDPLPHHICNDCAIATKNAYDLRRKYEGSYRYFRQQLLDLNNRAPETDSKESECVMNIKEEPTEPDSMIDDIMSDIETYDLDMVALKKEEPHISNESSDEEILLHKSRPELPPDNNGGNKFNLRLLLIRKREQLDSQEDIFEGDKGKGPLQCGLCFSRCGLTNWHTHLSEHYGVGWLHGQKPPSLTRGGLIAQMSSYLKEDRSNRLSCRLCNRQFGSGLGMMQHLEGCGEELQRFQCPNCNRFYTKLSLISHQRGCNKKDSVQKTGDDSSPKRICKRKPKLTPKMTWLMDDNSTRKTIDRSPFNLRLLLIRKREQLNTTEELREEGQGSGPLQCGLCLANCTKATWKMHIADHYGVGWIHEGIPHNVTRSGVITMMQSYLKENQGSRLLCRLCGREFASGLGMLLHLEGCGEKQQRLNCKFCSRSYTRLSLLTHLRSCNNRFEHKIQLPKPVESKKKRESRKESKVPMQKQSTKTPFNLRLLLMRNRDDLENQNDISEQGKGDGPLQCGLCLERSSKANWRKHLSTHYGVGWLTGQEPRTITRHSIIGLMNTYLKKNLGHRLNCRLCEREFSSGLGMLLHLEGCGIKKQRMKCKYCDRSFTRLSLLQHIRTCEKQFEKEIQLDFEAQTDVDDSGIEGAGSDDLLKSKRKRASQTHVCSKWSKTLYSRYHQLDNVVADKWRQFIEKNHAKDPLYSNYLPSYVNLSLDEVTDLLNSRQSNSMRFAYDKVENESDWRQLKPLETINAKNEFITYLGAPLRHLQWVPTPPTVSDQYLLCSLGCKMHEYTRYTDTKKDSALMLLLKCTVEPDSGSAEFWPLKTKLHYGIRVPNGPVFSFAFMPSGGYIESSNRLALLALATSSSDVQIYALPLELTNEKRIQAGQESVIELNCLITLRLDVKCSVQDPCTKICWSEAFGHNFLVSGYASGNVAFWNIFDNEDINCFKINNHCTFVPVHYFYFGERNIQFLELHYDTNGLRWLAVGTSLRKLRIYDLLNIAQPVLLVGDGELKNIFKGSISWPTIWETMTIGDASVFQTNFTRLVVVSPCGVLFNLKTIDYILDTARDMHFNCQENILIVVTENGDLAIINPRELNMEPQLRKSIHSSRAVSYTELVQFNEDSTKNKSISSDDFQRDYGVIIKPLIAIRKENRGDYLNQQRLPSCFDLGTMTRWNSVRWNSNRMAHSWVAIGAEHGMLRIMNFRRNEYFS